MATAGQRAEYSLSLSVYLKMDEGCYQAFEGENLQHQWKDRKLRNTYNILNSNALIQVDTLATVSADIIYYTNSVYII